MKPESETWCGVGTKHLNKYGGIRHIMESNFSLSQLGIITEDFYEQILSTVQYIPFTRITKVDTTDLVLKQTINKIA